jgi:uncharacterized membrane protein
VEPDQNNAPPLLIKNELVPEVEREVADQLPTQFQKLPASVRTETVRKVSVAAVKVSIQSWECDAGYPPPAILEEYDRLSPGSSTRIVQMAEGELKHNQLMEIKAANYFSRGQWMGFILALVAVIGSIGLVAIGKEITGGILGATIIIPLITLFIQGQLKIGKTRASNHTGPNMPKPSAMKPPNQRTPRKGKSIRNI